MLTSPIEIAKHYRAYCTALDSRHHRHLHLPRILHVLLDAVGDISGEEHSRSVVHLFGFDDDADFAARLDGVGLLDAGETGGDAL